MIRLNLQFEQNNIIMKQPLLGQNKETHHCQICNKPFAPSSSYSSQRQCEQCLMEKAHTTPKHMEQLQMQLPKGVSLEDDSPQDLVSKLKSPVSVHDAILRKTNSLGDHSNQNVSSDKPNVDEESDSEDSINEQQKHAKEQIEDNIRKEQLKIKAERKIIIGSGFSFDMTDFFKFKKKDELASNKGDTTFFQQISGSPLAWIILLYTVTSGSIVPGWIMNVQATKFARKAWRFIMQAAFMVPFIIYERRSGAQDVKDKYKLSYILDSKNIRKPYISSLSTSLWFLFVLTSFEWTFVSHGVVLGALSNFFLSVGRTLRGQNHQFESGGQVLVVLGVLLVIQDTILVNVDLQTVDNLGMVNSFYLRRTWWERVAGDLAAIFASFMMSQFSQYTSDLRSYYPPFLSIFLVNLFNTFHFCLIVFFFNGGTFSFEPFWGIFSIFTDEHFVSFMYMAIVLGCGQMASVFFVIRMFPDPIIPALMVTLEPFIATFILQLTGIQHMPGDFSMMGYLLIFPGMLAILVGQCFFQRQKSVTEETDKKVKQLLDEIKELKRLKENEEVRKQRNRSKRPQTFYVGNHPASHAS